MADPIDNTTLEEWRDVAGWEGFYQVSNMGRVKSLPRTLKFQTKAGWRTWPVAGGILLGNPGAHGYPVARLVKPGVVKLSLIHRLVCEAFHGPCPARHEVAHGNGIRTDNRASNLRWATKKSNHADKQAHGTWQGGEKNPFAKLTDADVRRIRRDFATSTLDEIAAEFQINKWHASKVRSGNKWSHIT